MTARDRSVAIIIFRREKRSTTTPANGANRTNGPILETRTAVAASAEPESDLARPSSAITCPVQSRLKYLFRDNNCVYVTELMMSPQSFLKASIKAESREHQRCSRLPLVR